jgi:hypothetical protein
VCALAVSVSRSSGGTVHRFAIDDFGDAQVDLAKSSMVMSGDDGFAARQAVCF